MPGTIPTTNATIDGQRRPGADRPASARSHATAHTTGTPIEEDDRVDARRLERAEEQAGDERDAPTRQDARRHEQPRAR